MRLLKWLSKKGIVLPTPKWLLHGMLLIQGGLRGASIGVRIAVLNEKEQIFLVRHSYVNGWYLPGGGVERGETALFAVDRELAEEAQMKAVTPPLLFGFYLNGGKIIGDYIACYILRDWQWLNGAEPQWPSPDGEIVDGRFFDIEALPEDTTPATRRRIAEILQEESISGHW